MKTKSENIIFVLYVIVD